MTQVTDPEISRRKFGEEVGRLASLRGVLTARGIWVMEATFPYVKVAFATVNMKPRVIAAAIRVDFTDYDARPLSVKFVDAFEDRELMCGELLSRLPKRIGDADPLGAEKAGQVPFVELCQAYGLDKPAFLCLAGVREYHDHPGHSGNPWELHRGSGGGSLFSIVDTVWRYGSDPLAQFGIQTVMHFVPSEYPT